MSDIKKSYPVEYKFRDEKLKVVNRYILGKTSGEGSYGKVKEGIDSKKKRRVALKILSRKFLRRATGGEASIEREISILSSLNHKNIIRLYNSFVEEENQKIYIVLEFAGGGNLQNFLDRIPDKRLPMPQARKYFHDLISGLLYLKQEKILHRDIKPDNLLLTIDGDLKISDFGIAEQCEPKDDGNTNLGESPGIGSPAYQAPELISSPPSSIENMYKTDVWSAGIVLYIMLVGEYPFPTQNNLMQLFEDITEGRYKIPDWLDENAKDLLKKMLQINPEERIDVSEILDHPWMTMDMEKTPFIPITALPTLFGGYNKQAILQTIKKMRNALKREKMRKCEEEEEDEEDGEGSSEKSSSEMSQSISSSSSSSKSRHNNRCIIL